MNIYTRESVVKEIWDKDAHKAQLCKQKGITLIAIWEDDWNSNKEEIKQNILQIIANKTINTIEVI